MSRPLSAAALAALVCLSACGVKGSLDAAPPMVGAERARWEAEQAEKRRAAAEKAAADAAARANAPAPASGATSGAPVNPPPP